jgi:hypothetical protein
VFARIVGLDGMPGPEIFVDPGNSTASAASVAVWADGTFVVVYIADIDSRPTILARMFNPDGSPKFGVPTRIAMNSRFLLTFWRVSAPTVTALAENYRFVVAWSRGSRRILPFRHRSFVSFRVCDDQRLSSTDEITVGITSSTSSEYNACVQIVELAPSLLAWAYQADDGRGHSQLQVIGGTDAYYGIGVGETYPSIAYLGPSPYIGRFSYVIAARSLVRPQTWDMWQVINYDIFDSWAGPPFCC